MSNLKNALVKYADEYDIMDLCAFEVYVEYVGGFEYIEQAATDFAEAFQGFWHSLEDFAYDFLSEINPDLIRALSEHNLEFQIDEIAWEQDYFISDDGYVFRTEV